MRALPRKLQARSPSYARTTTSYDCNSIKKAHGSPFCHAEPHAGFAEYHRFPKLSNKVCRSDAMRILITGGAGFIGRRIVRLLLSRRIPVVVVDTNIDAV